MGEFYHNVDSLSMPNFRSSKSLGRKGALGLLVTCLISSICFISVCFSTNKPELAAVIDKTATRQDGSLSNFSTFSDRAAAEVLPSIRMNDIFCQIKQVI